MADLFSDIVSHQIQLERAKAGESKRIREILDSLDDKIIASISRLPDDYTQSQLNLVLLQLARDIEKFYPDKVVPQLNKIGKQTVDLEVGFATRIIDQYLVSEGSAKSPNKSDILAIATQTNYQGKTLNTWANELAVDKINRVTRQLRTEAVEQAEVSALSRVAKQQIKIANNNAVAVTKAYVNQFTNISRDLTYQENEDFVDNIIWSTILDGRSTVTCGARSNKKYNAITKEPIDHENEWGGGPGAIHWGCRSIGIPVDKSGVIAAGPAKGEKFDSGSKTAVGGDQDYKRGDNLTKQGKVAKIPTSQNSLDKQVVPADLNYEDWLKTQPREFIEDSLGVEKARLFLDENVSIQDFVIPDGRELTIDQIAA
jgi:hypothetical protein